MSSAAAPVSSVASFLAGGDLDFFASFFPAELLGPEAEAAEDARYQAKEDASWREYQADHAAGFYAAA